MFDSRRPRYVHSKRASNHMYMAMGVSKIILQPINQWPFYYWPFPINTFHTDTHTNTSRPQLAVGDHESAVLIRNAAPASNSQPPIQSALHNKTKINIHTNNRSTTFASATGLNLQELVASIPPHIACRGANTQPQSRLQTREPLDSIHHPPHSKLQTFQHKPATKPRDSPTHSVCSSQFSYLACRDSSPFSYCSVVVAMCLRPIRFMIVMWNFSKGTCVCVGGVWPR